MAADAAKARALRKVLACLRLSKSANPTEAATALRQARALMHEYGLDAADIVAAEVSIDVAKIRRFSGAAPLWLAALASIVAAGFRCQAVFVRNWQTSSVEFVGLGSDPRVAAFAFLQLRRQIELDRSRHLARVRKRANREARGAAFCEGWVQAVSLLFPEGEVTKERQLVVAAWMQRHKPNLTEGGIRESKRIARTDFRDRDAGYEAGARAHVRGGLDGSTSSPPALEHFA